MDEFLALDKISDVDCKIAEVDIRLQSLEDRAKILGRPSLAQISLLPSIDIDQLSKSLKLGIEGLDQATVAAVKTRSGQLGHRGETWLSDGYEFSAALDQCALCGGDIQDNSYLELYRSCFGKNYKALAAELEKWKATILNVFSDETLDRTVSDVHKNGSVSSLWSDLLLNVKTPPELDASGVQVAFRQLRQEILSLLDEKISNPAESILFPDRLLSALSELQETIRNYNHRTEGFNEQIDCTKRDLVSSSKDELAARKALLTATKNRWSTPLSSICADIIEATERKDVLNAEKELARRSLDEYRRSTFCEYQALVNEHLNKCGAGWRITGMEHRNTARGSSTQYEFRIEDSDIVVAVNSTDEDGPSFKTTLSAGDRSALALSLFFASLRREDLSDAVVVIDDPVTSLDIRWQRATINEIVAISKRSAQVIVLSHERDFLIRLWKALGMGDVQPMCLEVGSETPSSSKITIWDVNDAALTEENRALMRVERYTEQPHRDCGRTIARDIRMCVESHFHQLYPGRFSPDRRFASSLAAIRDAGMLSSEAHDNVRELCDYSNEYHHPDSDDPDSLEVAPALLAPRLRDCQYRAHKSLVQGATAVSEHYKHGGPPLVRALRWDQRYSQEHGHEREAAGDS